MVEKFIMAGSTPLHICDSEGDSPSCVVLLHGYLESSIVWEDFVSLLYKSVRVISLDLPGHGISLVKGEVHTMEYLADTVAAALDTLGVGKVTLVGHSMGGYVALAFAEKYAERLEHLVLFSSHPNADSEEKKEQREREIALVQAGKKEMIAKVAPAAGFAAENRQRMRDYIEDLVELVTLTEDDGIVVLLRGMMQRKNQNDMLAALKVPQTFIFGRYDELIPEAMALEISARHPQASVKWLENSGHMGFFEQPEQAAEYILQAAGVDVKNDVERDIIIE